MSERSPGRQSLGLNPDDLDTLRSVAIQVSESRRLNLLELLGAWQAHVIKLEDDIPLPSSERLAWGAYDLIAALTLRDFVEVGMSSLQASIGRRFREVLREIDDQFISYTEKDKLNRLAVLDGRPIEDCGWWWGRIPKAGPAREEVISITGL